MNPQNLQIAIFAIGVLSTIIQVLVLFIFSSFNARLASVENALITHLEDHAAHRFDPPIRPTFH